MRAFFVFFFILPLCSLAQAQQTGIDITKLMTYFVVSAVAEDQCLHASDDEKAQFNKNLLVVSLKTVQVVKERSPGKSDETIKQEFDTFYSGVRQRYSEALQKAGCDSTLGKQGSDLWKVNVNWQQPL
jgi:hypothetical protein